MSRTPETGPLPNTPVFTGARLDRVAATRHDPEAIARLLSDSTPAALACNAKFDLAVDGDGLRLARLPWDGDPSDAVLLGVEDGQPLIAVELAEDSELTTMALRDAGTALAHEEAGLAGYLVGLMNWHRRHPCCSVCGHATNVHEAGLARKCPNCGASHFPRTDPVVIMTVEHDGRLLMGSRPGWGQRYSVLAGFVSPGETLEEAVVREVQEESGIIARDAAYVTSQPWPFPASLMLGFHAISDGGDPAPADGELSDVRWFPREEVIAMQNGESDFALPPEVSIARVLIDHWVAGA